jgi:mannitol 2-dehydrogenase
MILSNATLSALPTSVAGPAYDRSALRPGIVHIGCGNFHRAHMAVYLDDLFQLGKGHDWAILGAGVREGDARMRDMLAKQDYLSTVIERSPAGVTTRVIGAMTGFVPVEVGNAALIAAMSDAAIKIVSLTVTEGGYYIDPKTGTFAVDHPDIRHDAANPAAPNTVFGAIIAALAARRKAGQAAFTVMCCDNLPHNGHVTRNAVVGLARLSDPALAEWIAQSVAFPNSMVDRITPATGDAERALVRSLGIEDDAPVTCEPFRQWVMEDNFPTGRPAFEKVGVTFTPRVDAFETMKIRVLNGGHAIIAYPAGLLDIHYVHDAMADPMIRAFLDRILQNEVLPIVPPVPGVALPDYKALIIDRFSNPEVADTVRRLCLDGSNRQPKFIIPSIRDAIAHNGKMRGLILSSALWCRYCYGTAESGADIAPNDPNWDRLQSQSVLARSNPKAWLEMAEIYGDLGQNADLVAQFTTALAAVWEKGTRIVIGDYLAG